MPRTAPVVLALLVCQVFFGGQRASAQRMSLMQTLEPWRYPGSEFGGAQMSDGATIDASGARTSPSVFCKAAMTTDAPVEEVLEFYRAKLTAKPSDESEEDAKPDRKSGRSVVFNDDSQGRPFALHTIFVNANNASTTLVITRGQDEPQTHIAWKHYRRFDAAQ